MSAPIFDIDWVVTDRRIAKHCVRLMQDDGWVTLNLVTGKSRIYHRHPKRHEGKRTVRRPLASHAPEPT